MDVSLEYARRQDEGDELASFREQFVIADPDLIYLDGNSLGRLPRRAGEALQRTVEQEWGERLIRGWGEGWFHAARRVGDKIAQLAGAEAGEVIAADSTSVNLFKLALAALQARPGRRKVVTDDLNFPSDLYVLQGALRLAGGERRLVVARSPDGLTMPTEILAQAIDEDTALVALTHTAFKSGYLYDMEAVTAAAHRAGALMLWDLSHSAGAMPLRLGECGADLAVGCTYKYLNGGPGAPAFLFVRRDLQEDLLSPIWGWFGRRDQFDMALDYEPGPGVQRFLAGTTPVLGLAAVEAGVDLLLQAGPERLRAKSVRQSEYLIGLWEALLRPLGMRLNSPRDPARRGSHVALGHADALRIDRALIEEMNVVPDFRQPDNIRFGIAPIYTTFVELHTAVTRLRQVLAERLHERYPRARPEVT